MKTLVVIPTLGYGGAERLLVTLLPKMKERGFQIKVCTLSAPLDLATELEKEGISVVNIELSHRWSIVEALIKLYKEIKTFNPDMVFGHLYFGIFYARLISLFFSNLKVISVLHYNISEDSVKKGLWYSFRNWIFDKSKRFDFSTVAVSQSVKRDYEKFFGWKDIEVVFNAIDLEKIDNAILDRHVESLRKQYNVLPDDFVITLPGRLHESKGHRYLIEALKLIKEKHHLRPKVIIAGEGALRKEIESLIVCLELDNQFILTGNLKQEELFSVMKASDLIVIPSLFEAFGIATIEAMYLEKPMVVTEIDGLKEITTNNVDAMQVPVKNSDAIANAIIQMNNNHEYRSHLAKNAKETALKYDINVIVREWENIFERELK